MDSKSSVDRMTAEAVARETGESDGFAPADHGGDILPFVQLSGARFELLTYLLLEAESPPPAAVTLLQASRDRGRDVLVYSGGKLRRIVQCKNLQDRMNEPSVIVELLKLALHGHLAREVLPTLHDGGAPIEVEFWAPADFTEPAADLIDNWPAGWTAERVQGAFAEICKTYARFKTLDWKDVRSAVIERFPLAVSVRKLTGPSISMRVRHNTSLYQRFFRGGVFAELPDIERTLKKVLESKRIGGRSATKTPGGLLIGSGEFHSSNRVFLGKGYLLGMRPEFLRLLTPEETRAVAENVIMPAARLAVLAMSAGKRIVTELVMKKFESLPMRNSSFAWLVAQFGVLRFLKHLRAGGADGLTRAGLNASDLADFETALPRLAAELWSGYQRVLSNDFKAPTSDQATEALRLLVAENAVAKYSTQGKFIEDAVEDRKTYRTEGGRTAATRRGSASARHCGLFRSRLGFCPGNRDCDDRASVCRR